jgi:hypothetical protein
MSRRTKYTVSIHAVFTAIRCPRCYVIRYWLIMTYFFHGACMYMYFVIILHKVFLRHNCPVIKSVDPKLTNTHVVTLPFSGEYPVFFLTLDGFSDQRSFGGNGERSPTVIYDVSMHDFVESLTREGMGQIQQHPHSRLLRDRPAETFRCLYTQM